jgi:hypothetical protein
MKTYKDKIVEKLINSNYTKSQRFLGSLSVNQLDFLIKSQVKS